MKSLVFFATVTAGLLALASSVLFEKKGESFVQQFKNEQGILTTRIKNQDFKVIDTFDRNGVHKAFLLDAQKELRTFEQMEGIQGELQLDLYSSMQNRFDTRVWQIKESATEWSYLWEPQLIITKLSGCCGAMEGARAFNFQTGKLIMSYTPMIDRLGEESAPFILEIPNTPISRLVGVMSADSLRDFPENLLKRDARGYQSVAIVKYSDLKALTQKLLIKIKVPEHFSASIGDAKWILPTSSKSEIRGGRVTLWDQDANTDVSKISGPIFQVKIYGDSGESIVRLPVKADKFDLSGVEKSAHVEVIDLTR
ncbi:MAG: hypothetical protein RJB66_2508 [Pseudomonadota bacterium]|jgi:hypothetical protein